MRFFMILLVVVLLVTLTYPVAAKGPFERVILKMGNRQIFVTRDDLLPFLSMAQLEELENPLAEEPQNLGEGVELIRQYREHDTNRLFTFDRVMYYPDLDGGRGYIYNLGMEGASYEYDHQWFRVSATGEAVIQHLLSRGRVPLPEVVLSGCNPIMERCTFEIKLDS